MKAPCGALSSQFRASRRLMTRPLRDQICPRSSQVCQPPCQPNSDQFTSSADMRRPATPEQANGWSPYRRLIWSAQTARSFWARSMSATAIDFTPNNSSPRSTACVVAGTREALVALWRVARPEPPKPGRRRRLADLVDTVRVEGDVILDLRHRFKWGLISPHGFVTFVGFTCQ
jgi:hypothetical protein